MLKVELNRMNKQKLNLIKNKHLRTFNHEKLFQLLTTIKT